VILEGWRFPFGTAYADLSEDGDKVVSVSVDHDALQVVTHTREPVESVLARIPLAVLSELLKRDAEHQQRMIARRAETEPAGPA
jgi:hypothetical protein